MKCQPPSIVMNMHMWILAILSFATFFTLIEMFDNYGDICTGLCVCEERDGIFTASCENRGINNLSEVTPLHFTAYHLLLTGNLLKKVSLNDFVHYEGLTILHLGNNDISEIEGGAFNGLQGLKRLHLNNNKIEALKDDTFLGLESLEYLQIDYNYISHVEAKALSDLRHLEVLILNDNLLSALPNNIFQYVPLTHLDLRGNQLKVLPYIGLLEHLSHIVELQLEENPWSCSCELITLKAWLESISYTALVGDVVCETPFRLHGRDLDEISKQELCPRRAIAEYEMRAEPAHSSEILYKTTSATFTAGFASSTILRATKSSRLSGKLRVKPTSRSSSSNDLRHLEVLILNDNLLSALPNNIFQYVPLTHLDLRGNQLKVLPYIGLLEHLSHIVELQLEENPWSCSCELITLKAWLESISYTALVGDVVCETPFRLHGRDLDEISKQELCPRRAIAEYEMRAEPAHSSEILYKTTSATFTAGFASSTILRATKSSRLSGKLRVKPTSRSSSSKPQNYGPMLAYQTKSPVTLDCPNTCTCNLQISDLGLNVNCQERKIESISDLDPKPYNPKKMYLTGNYISSVCSSDFNGATGLDLLHLGNNRIAVIHDRTFGQLIHLRRLYLNGNLIERLTEDMFYGLQSLQFLYLEYNVIREIAVVAFQQVPNLQLLFLNNNLLKTLPLGVFDELRLARLNLRSNHFRTLPVAGVLEDLTSLLQIDLFENPWDCSCLAVEMKNWLEQLSTGTMVNSVVCESPLSVSGEDMRYVHASHLCPESSNAQSSVVPPSEESFPGSTITLESALDYDTQYPAVPLSVLILALLLLFILSVFVAAGLFAVIMKRRKKSERLASVTANASSFNAIYTDRAKSRTSTGHVYEYIPSAAESGAKNSLYSEGRAIESYRDFEELNRVLASNSDEDVGSNAISSEFSAGTPDALNRHSPLLDDNYFYRDILARDQQASYRGNLACKHGTHASAHCAPDFDVRHQYLNPERVQQTMVYCSMPNTVCIEPNRSEYWELKAKLHFEPDYLEVHEKRTTFTQF
uniref:SLIT and NTRK-like protein 5 n=1 Tax=Sinocyclocheilus rhinocerous TaxID=307959 RepID=A0A673H9K0_9TELE